MRFKRVGQHLKKLTEAHGVAKTCAVFQEALDTKKINPYEVCLAEVARAFLGDVFFDAQRIFKAISQGKTHLLEATEAVDASAFGNITGQLLVTIIKEKYESPEFVGSKLVRVTPNPGGNLKEHKVPYLSDVKDRPAKLAQGEPYPQTQFAESWVTLPAPEKYGEVCAVTMEMLFSDLTGQAQDSAASVGRVMGYLRDERILRVVLGLSNPYKFNDTTMNTYLSTENATGKYVNRLAASTVSNYTHVNTIEQLFWKMRDPITDRRVYSRPNAILVMPEKRYELKRILNATETRSGDITTGSGDQVLSSNPLEIDYTLHTSAIAQQLLDDETSLTAAQIKEYQVYADFARAFGYREVYPMSTVVAPPQNQMEFLQDIVLAVKVQEFGVPYVYDPRYAVLSTSEAS